MIEKKPDLFSDIVDRAMGELRSSPVPLELPPELLNALLQAAKENTGAVQCTVEASAQAEIIRPTFLTRSLGNWRWIMRHPVSRATAAAIFLFTIGGVVLWFHTAGTTFALADFIKPILEAKSAKYKATIEAVGRTQTDEVMWLAPNRIRTERNAPGEPRMVWISDLEKRKTLTLFPDQKQATVTTMTNIPKETTSKNWFAEMRSLLADAQVKPDIKREPLGEKEIDGHRVVGYRVSGSGLGDRGPPGTTMTLWGDPKTGLPVRIEVDAPNSSMGMKYRVTMSAFVFNADLGESLFSVEPPAGYTIRRMQLDASPAEEKDLIETLRQYGNQGGGDFPDMLDLRAVFTVTGKGAYKFEMKGGKKPKEQQIKEAMKESEQQIQKTMAAEEKRIRGLTFVLQLPPDADAHYAGKGVKLGAADSPIFWYHPKDSKKYRVIYADLSVREADTAPSVANAQPVVSASGPKK